MSQFATIFGQVATPVLFGHLAATVTVHQKPAATTANVSGIFTEDDPAEKESLGELRDQRNRRTLVREGSLTIKNNATDGLTAFTTDYQVTIATELWSVTELGAAAGEWRMRLRRTVPLDAGAAGYHTRPV